MDLESPFDHEDPHDIVGVGVEVEEDFHHRVDYSASFHADLQKNHLRKKKFSFAFLL
jgi:hypothetical protein